MRHSEIERQRQFTRRALLLAGGKTVLLAALGARMYMLQVLESDRYRLMADDNRINIQLLPPSRGLIVDRFGEPLAINEQNYRVLITSEETPDVARTLDRLALIVDLDAEARARILSEVGQKRQFVPVTVKEFLSWEQVARIEVNAPDMPGISIDVGERRNYPQRSVAAHALGYVARVASSDLTGDPLLQIPGFRVGRQGIERTYDRALRGRAGTRQLEVNASGRVIRELERVRGQSGQTVVLTIDTALQRFALQRMGGQSGAIVVMDITGGELVALVSAPSFDPNAFTRGLSEAEWAALRDDERSPLRDKAVAGEYAPGSTFKMMVALAALESGMIDEYTQFFCPGWLKLGDRTFHCWKRSGHGDVRLYKAIVESCDVYFYEVALRIGIDRIAAMAKRFGLGDRLGIDLPGEHTGLIPTEAWKRAEYGQPWHTGESLIAGIGQGFVLATPLQLAVMTAELVNGGRRVTPRIARDIYAGDTRLARPPRSNAPIGIKPRYLALVRKAMQGVTTDPRGTAYRARIGREDMEMGGKTGTSQVRTISQLERDTGILANDDLPWRSRDHALFVGFGPIGNPRYAVSVVVEHGGGGSSVAAPIARDVMAWTLNRDPLTRVAAGRPSLVRAQRAAALTQRDGERR